MTPRAETALITGASGGIGLALARLFAADRSDLVLVARSAGKLEQLAAELAEEYEITARALTADLALPGAASDIHREISGRGAEIDVVVNNAGFGARGTVAELELERQVGMVQVNVAALTELTRLFLPAMLERGRGGILNVGSTAGFQPGPGMSVYYATKAYVISFTEGLAEEVAGSGVKVSCLAPGATHTGFAAEARMEDSLLFKLGAMDVETVARAGYAGFRRGKVIVIPGLKNKLTPLSVRFAPRALVRKIVKRLQ